MKKALLFIAVLLGAMPAAADEFTIEIISFESEGAALEGSLVLPAEGTPHAAVVFVHGSGPQERNLFVAHRFAEDGIAAFVYDKRGVGRSGGTYEDAQNVSGMNIKLLAADAAAAAGVLHSHPVTKDLPIGLTGVSQAGWIVPIAAETVQTDFLVLWSGPVTKVSEEDIFSKHTRDLDTKQVPSYSEALAARETPYIWPDFLGRDTDPADELARLDMPGLWVFGEKDGSVPVDLSIERLKLLIKDGKPYEYALFSKLGHNTMRETFRMVNAWILRETY